MIIWVSAAQISLRYVRDRCGEDICGILLHLRQDMAVGLQGQCDVGVSEALADDLGMHTVLHQERGMGMAQAMERDARHAGRLDQFDEAMDVVVVQGLLISLGTHGYSRANRRPGPRKADSANALVRYYAQDATLKEDEAVLHRLVAHLQMEVGALVGPS